jgi:GNAT superfamily N-acetyltransferase
VNLFLYPPEECDEGGGEQGRQETGMRDVVGELEIMIARADARGKGLAEEALRAFVWYISTSLPAILDEYAKGADDTDKSKSLSYLRVKVDKDNIRSLGLFRKLGFSQVSEPNYFGEVELRSNVVKDGIVQVAGFAKILCYGD